MCLWELGFICSFPSLATSSGIVIIGDRRMASCPSPSPSMESMTALRKSEGEDSSFGMSFLWHQTNKLLHSISSSNYPSHFLYPWTLRTWLFLSNSAEGWTTVNTFMIKDQEETISSSIDTFRIRMVWELYSEEWHRPSAV